MRLTVQKRLAAQILKCSPDRVWVDPERLEEIKEAITKQDIRVLIGNKLIIKRQIKGQSRVRARKKLVQKRKGRQKGKGSRKGTKKVRSGAKLVWIRNVRVRRNFVRELKQKDLINTKVYKDMRSKIKGGFFRSRRHIKLYLNEKGLINKK